MGRFGDLEIIGFKNKMTRKKEKEYRKKRYFQYCTLMRQEEMIPELFFDLSKNEAIQEYMERDGYTNIGCEIEIDKLPKDIKYLRVYMCYPEPD